MGAMWAASSAITARADGTGRESESASGRESESASERGSTDEISQLPDMPWVRACTTSLVGGVAVGYAVKKVGRAATLAAGLTLIAAQAAHHYDLIEFDAGQMARDAERALDARWGDGDGTWSQDDTRRAAQAVVRVTSANLPDAAGFGTGVWLGFRWG